MTENEQEVVRCRSSQSSNLCSTGVKPSGDRPVAFVPLLVSFQTCGRLAQGQWGRKDASGLVIRLRLAAKRFMRDNLCMGA